MVKDIRIKKKNFGIFGAGAVFLVLVLFYLSGLSFSIEEHPSDLQKLDVETRFSILSQQRTNSCGGGKDYISQLSYDGTRIQGPCCSRMNLHSYKEQLKGLEHYANYDIIPLDPYDVSAEWAEEMIRYSEKAQLDLEQQSIYEKAVDLSHEGGPCCCKCWHWYAYEGLAKYLIINKNFSAEQIAEIWDLSDACGGDHHHHEI